jgi:hypothetical protein
MESLLTGWVREMFGLPEEEDQEHSKLLTVVTAERVAVAADLALRAEALLG